MHEAWNDMDSKGRLLDIFSWSLALMDNLGRSLEEDMASNPLAGIVGKKVYM